MTARISPLSGLATVAGIACHDAAWASGTWIAQTADALPFAVVATLWLALIAAVMIAMALVSRKWRAGKPAARRTARLAESLLDPKTYRLMRDVTFENRNGIVHIDLVVVSPFGVFIIEAMDMRGDISGKAFDPEWTNTDGGETRPFPNPLRPNFNRKQALNELLRIGEDRIFSIIAFTEKARFAIPMPDNVTRGRGFADYIASKDATLIDANEIPGIMDRIGKAMVTAPAARTRRKGAGSPLRFMNLLKFAAMAAALAGGSHVLHNTAQYPDMPNPIAWLTGAKPASRTEVTRTEPARRAKAPRSDAYGFLTLKAGRDTRLTLTDAASGIKVIDVDMKKGESREIEIKKGYYKAEILQDGQLLVRRVSFLGSTGTLDF